MTGHHVVLATYECYSRYSGTQPCSALQHYGTFVLYAIAIAVAIAGLFTHQGYRYSRGRGSIFGTRSLLDDESERRDEENMEGAALLAQSMHQTGYRIPDQTALAAGVGPEGQPGGPPGVPHTFTARLCRRRRTGGGPGVRQCGGRGPAGRGRHTLGGRRRCRRRLPRGGPGGPGGPGRVVPGPRTPRSAAVLVGLGLGAVGGRADRHLTAAILGAGSSLRGGPVGAHITVVGGGSTHWTPTLLVDFANSPVLHDAELALVDVDPASLAPMVDLTAHVAATKGIALTARAAGSLDEGLDGAEIVLTTLSVGGFASMALDIEVPYRYGDPPAGG